jgi:hypothetical protein
VTNQLDRYKQDKGGDGEEKEAETKGAAENVEEEEGEEAKRLKEEAESRAIEFKELLLQLQPNPEDRAEVDYMAVIGEVRDEDLLPDDEEEDDGETTADEGTCTTH